MPAGRGKEAVEKDEQQTDTEDTTVEATEEHTVSEPAAEEPATVEVVDAESSAIEVSEPVGSDSEDQASDEAPETAEKKTQWSRVFAFGVLPAIALLLALAAGFARWEYNTSQYGALPPAVSDQNPSPAVESMNAAKDSTIKMLSYKPETVGEQLNAARDLLTGEFRESYTSLINDVVIPGATQKKISAVASVPAMASVSADPSHAVVLLFVNQTVVVGQEMPTDTASSVRVTLDKIDGRWLISEFEPV